MKADSRIAAALDFMVANAHRDVSVKELADVAGLSEPRFSHMFAVRAGVTPGALLRMQRQLREEQNFILQILQQLRSAAQGAGDRCASGWRTPLMWRRSCRLAQARLER